MTQSVCTYCGGPATTKDHVVPRCLYTRSDTGQNVQRITVPCCERCNTGWSDDEVHFRNILTIAGDPNPAVHRLWEKVRRSFHARDGRRRLRELAVEMRPATASHRERHMVFPGGDEKVMRVIRKIISGLCHHHYSITPVLDHRVFADVMKYEVPPEFEEAMQEDYQNPEVFQCKHMVINQLGFHSPWLLTFFERTTFFGAVSMSPEGFTMPGTG